MEVGEDNAAEAVIAATLDSMNLVSWISGLLLF
jgi:hypothetical protein